jgi:hypothetical protein
MSAGLERASRRVEWWQASAQIALKRRGEQCVVWLVWRECRKRFLENRM